MTEIVFPSTNETYPFPFLLFLRMLDIYDSTLCGPIFRAPDFSGLDTSHFGPRVYGTLNNIFLRNKEIIIFIFTCSLFLQTCFVRGGEEPLGMAMAIGDDLGKIIEIKAPTDNTSNVLTFQVKKMSKQYKLKIFKHRN
jgi:hypothetical protein